MKDRKEMGVLGLIAVCFVSFAYMSDLIIIPAAGSLFEAYPDASPLILNFILSGTMLLSIVSALLAPILMRNFSKKNIIIVLFAIFAVAGSAELLTLNLSALAVMRAIIGLSFGALMSTAISLITEIYRDDEKKCSKYVGIYNGSMTLLGIPMLVISGFLCTIRWNYVFYEFLAAFPMLIMMIIFLPKTPAEKQQANSESEKTTVQGSVKMPTATVAAMLGSIVAIGILYNFMGYENSIYLAENNLGDSSVSGIISSAMAIAGCIAGFGFGVFYLRMKRGTITLVYGLTALGYLGLNFIFGTIWAAVCLAILGFAYSLSVAYFYAYASSVVPESKNSLVMSLITVAIGIGTFLTTYAATFFGNALSAETVLALCPVYAGFSGIGGIISLALFIISRKKAAVQLHNV